MEVVWYPAADSSEVVGYFDYEEKLDKAASREAGEYVYKKVVVLRHKAIGSNDLSTQELKPAARSRYIARFPEAWGAFERGDVPKRDDGVIMPAGVTGTPLPRLGFAAQQIMLYNAAGIYTVEQMAAASEAIRHRLGFGADKVIQRAKDFLAEKDKPKRGRPPKVKEEA